MVKATLTLPLACVPFCNNSEYHHLALYSEIRKVTSKGLHQLLNRNGRINQTDWRLLVRPPNQGSLEGRRPNHSSVPSFSSASRICSLPAGSEGFGKREKRDKMAHLTKDSSTMKGKRWTERRGLARQTGRLPASPSEKAS